MDAQPASELQPIAVGVALTVEYDAATAPPASKKKADVESMSGLKNFIYDLYRNI